MSVTLSASDKSPHPQTCLECGEPTAGRPNLYLGTSRDRQRSYGRLCVDCVERLQRTSGVPSNLPRFVSWYLKSRVMDAKDKRIYELEQQVAELKAKLGD